MVMAMAKSQKGHEGRNFTDHTARKSKERHNTRPGTPPLTSRSKQSSRNSPPTEMQWPELFSGHIKLIQRHVRMLRDYKRDVKIEMEGLTLDERRQWEEGTIGNWKVVCGVYDQSRELLVLAKKAAEGREGTVGGEGTGSGIESNSDSDSDGEERSGSSSSSSTSNSGTAESNSKPTNPTPQHLTKHSNKRKATSIDEPEESLTPKKKGRLTITEHSSFTFQTEPIPFKTFVAGNNATASTRPIKIPKSKKKNRETAQSVEDTVQKPNPAPDFAALQAHLQAEVTAGLARAAEAAAEEARVAMRGGSKDRKKRKRDSIGGEGIVESKKSRAVGRKDGDEGGKEEQQKGSDKKRKAGEVVAYVDGGVIVPLVVAPGEGVERKKMKSHV